MPSTKKAPAAKPAPKKTPMEEFVGPSLLTAVDTPPKPTKEVLKGKDIVAFYFSAAWCSPCKQFTPVLIDFYNAVGKDGGLEVVYISSDSDMKEFNEYFGKMPWVAQPVDAESAQIKNTMAQSLKIAGIPALIIMDVKTGNFITDMARVEVMQAGTDAAKRLEVLNGWKKAEAVPISEATLTGGKGPFSYWDLFLSVLRNPAVLIAFLYFGKKVIKALVEYGKEGDAVNAESEL